ncbi:MAG: DMT family transporter [Actinomycetota bacterium]|nr:DMT family transporter [Actinomycetota bacterium]
MAAVLGGLGAALLWSVGIAFAAQATRDLGPILTLAWVMPIGLVVLVPVLIAAGHVHLSAAAAAWLALGGAGNVGGLLILYHALRIGQMSIVMPIVSTEGGIAAGIAIMAGESISAIGAAALAVTVAGVVMTAVVRRLPGEAPVPATNPHPARGSAAAVIPRRRTDRQAAAWAVASALSMGVSLYGTGRAGTLLPTAWAVLPAAGDRRGRDHRAARPARRSALADGERAATARGRSV